jgi:Fur family zinc uptake transcriptional regulator
MTIDEASLVIKCRSKSKALTPKRLEILIALEEVGYPITAYDLRSRLLQKVGDLNISTIYRVLDFWIEIGLIHKIESNNTYLVCHDDHSDHLHVLQHCISCNLVSETCELSSQFQMPRTKSFLVNPSQVIEVKGQCSSCLNNVSQVSN